jgi:hypothetical protein
MTASPVARHPGALPYKVKTFTLDLQGVSDERDNQATAP